MTELYVAKVPDKTILDMLTDLKQKFGDASISVDVGGVAVRETEYELMRKRKGGAEPPRLYRRPFSLSYAAMA
uniref:hypothetical protein n=1 Tax=uncultured Rhizobium sp. TaxID=155567 RepID=UPI0026261538